jgi:hypothetical protein
MKPLFTEEEYKNAKSIDKLPLTCCTCENTFHSTKAFITQAKRKENGATAKYCSRKCTGKGLSKRKNVSCKQCKKLFLKKACQIKKSPNHFCTKSCAVTYNNTHKKHGTRRSKLEVWLEKQLTLKYPDIKFDFNRKEAINSELDIFLPEYKLAFELNGIFHYEPIFGEKKLAQINNNDSRKFQACIEAGIELCIIDASSLKYFKPSNAQKYLDITSNIIKQRLERETED